MNDLPELVMAAPLVRTDREWREWAVLLAEQGKAELAHYQSLKEIVEGYRKAVALEAYFRQLIQDEQHKQAAANELKELQLWQQRAVGGWLSTLDTRGDGRPKETVTPETVSLPSLKDLGVSRVQAHRWQTIATLPEPVFTAHIAQTKARREDLTTKGLYQLAKDEAKEALRKAKRQAEYGPLPGDVQLYCGTFQAWGPIIADASVDCILTDLPYGEDWLPQIADLGALAARVLKPGGTLFMMYGQYCLRRAMNLMFPYLGEAWPFDYRVHGKRLKVDAWHIRNGWKPCLWYWQGQYTGAYPDDTLDSERDPDKQYDPWGQSVSVFKLIIKRLTSPGDLILDPCVGGGSTAEAAHVLRRRFIGIDLDPGDINATRGRITAIREADQQAAELEEQKEAEQRMAELQLS